ncbi:hypothetical protein OF83DRAFT_1049297 [Amylostereum chailletii]|nr:hypothetical protein OF83DRAFT_1049297 [Amylostereum chailletii]
MFVHSLLSLLLASLVAADGQYRILHRVFHPSLESTGFFERGTLLIDAAGLPTLQPSSSLSDDLRAFAFASHHPDFLYQIALAPPDGSDSWDISSVKACYLRADTLESILLHYPSDEPGAAPYALDFFVSPLPHDGTCPPGPPLLAAPRNTSIAVSFPRRPPVPELHAPPQLSPQGEVVQPVPEKSFIQKYWIYAVIVLGAMRMSLLSLLLSPSSSPDFRPSIHAFAYLRHVSF